MKIFVVADFVFTKLVESSPGIQFFVSKSVGASGFTFQAIMSMTEIMLENFLFFVKINEFHLD